MELSYYFTTFLLLFAICRNGKVHSWHNWIKLRGLKPHLKVPRGCLSSTLYKFSIGASPDSALDHPVNNLPI